MFLPLVISLYFGNGGEIKALAYSMFITLAAGGVLKYFFRLNEGELSIREGFIAVVVGWVICAFFGALPYIFTSCETG
ncbi:MAG TPA: hypothetical protein ACFYD3_01380 [Candidatus Hypogeohydataceae bacterium YC41]